MHNPGFCDGHGDGGGDDADEGCGDGVGEDPSHGRWSGRGRREVAGVDGDVGQRPRLQHIHCSLRRPPYAKVRGPQAASEGGVVEDGGEGKRGGRKEGRKD